jgi:hypothetical protein
MHVLLTEITSATVNADIAVLREDNAGQGFFEPEHLRRGSIGWQCLACSHRGPGGREKIGGAAPI